jgi:hypothetical protein
LIVNVVFAPVPATTTKNSGAQRFPAPPPPVFVVVKTTDGEALRFGIGRALTTATAAALAPTAPIARVTTPSYAGGTLRVGKELSDEERRTPQTAIPYIV